MSELAASFVNATRLLVDLQTVNAIVQSFSGHREPEAIARRATDGLVAQFNCAFARLWLMEPDGLALRLVASSGMYTHTNGFFAKVPLGAFKVGKIAQNRIPFLSNNLPDEPWVKDRDWAIAHQITGFAGYPLIIADRVVGVLAVFSHDPLSAEFLEVLQGLCTTLALTLDNSLQAQSAVVVSSSTGAVSLSEQLANLLPQARLTLLGTERSLSTSLNCLLMRTAEALREMDCTYCRLSYGATQITLEAMVFPPMTLPGELRDWATSMLGDIRFAITCLGGTLQTFTGANQKVVQVVLQVPYPICALGPSVRIHLSSPLLQSAVTQVAYLAGLTLCSTVDPTVPVLTDDLTEATRHERVLWLAHSTQIPPLGILAKLDLALDPAQLREAVEAAHQGKPWGIVPELEESQGLSEREREILRLLAEGLRDRDIASTLHISERTVKFHITNLLTKLNARTRSQAMHRAAINGWL